MSTLLLTIPETAEELRVSVPTVYRRIGAGLIPVIDVAPPGSSKSKLRVRRAALDAYVERLSGDSVPAA